MNYLETLKKIYHFDEFKSGAFCLWVTEKDSEQGLKLYFSKHMDTKLFIGQQKTWPLTRTRSASEWKLLDYEDLLIVYSTLSELHKYDLHPKPHRIFEEGNIRGIIIDKAHVPAPEDIYNRREQLVKNYHMFDLILGNAAHYVKNVKGKYNWGMIDGKLVVIDIDVADLRSAGLIK